MMSRLDATELSETISGKRISKKLPAEVGPTLWSLSGRVPLAELQHDDMCWLIAA